MNIVCAKNILNGAITPALSTVSNKNTNKALEGLLITANQDDGTLVICSYDTEKGVKVTVSGENVQINESGKIILNAEKFASIVKNLPDGNVSIIVDDKLTAKIKSNKSEFTLQVLDGEDFPLIPELKGEKNFTVSRKILKNMIASTLFSVAVNNSRPALNGALFEIKNNKISVVSVDGNRLSLKRSFEGLTLNEGLDLNFIVPGKSLAELLKLIGEDDKPAVIELTNKHVIISFDNIIFFSRLIEGEFLDYSKVIKINPKTTVVVKTKIFLESVERAAVLTDDKTKTMIKLNFNKEEININNRDEAGILRINAESSAGKAQDECDIDIYGDDILIGFNSRYLAEALRAVKEEQIQLKLESPTKSMLIMSYDKNKRVDDMDIGNCKFLYLVLPIRLKD